MHKALLIVTILALFATIGLAASTRSATIIKSGPLFKKGAGPEMLINDVKSGMVVEMLPQKSEYRRMIRLPSGIEGWFITIYLRPDQIGLGLGTPENPLVGTSGTGEVITDDEKAAPSATTSKQGQDDSNQSSTNTIALTLQWTDSTGAPTGEPWATKVPLLRELFARVNATQSGDTIITEYGLTGYLTINGTPVIGPYDKLLLIERGIIGQKSVRVRTPNSPPEQ